ncbi:MAG: LysE family transporter [Sedimentisphaerales bacterium]|nr:LysE family transporter [Sedimentisphaerales bacterium]
MQLFWFLLSVVGISLSGVMAPGPVTATTIVMGSRNRWAGVLIAVGHGIVELPLIILIVLGINRILKSQPVQIGIGLAGGLFLIIMAVQIMGSLRRLDEQQTESPKGTPIIAGIVLTAGNPYFLLWWATIGLGLATRAGDRGAWAFALFALVHWLCDLVWLAALAWASFKGSELLGTRALRVVLIICSLALFAFAAMFLYDAVGMLISLFGA